MLGQVVLPFVQWRLPPFCKMGGFLFYFLRVGGRIFPPFIKEDLKIIFFMS